MLSHLKEHVSSVILFMQILTTPSGGGSYYDTFCRGGSEAQRLSNSLKDTQLINYKKAQTQL